MAEYVKIPKDRVGVLIGREGRTKAMLEKRCKVKLHVNEGGGVSIVSPEEDGLAEWKAKDVVKAVGRGFNPKLAATLLKDDYVLWIVNLYDVLGRKDSDLRRIKARLIGESGKARRTVETLTDTRMSVYGRTVALIGREEDVELARKGIQMVIDGARHASVYNFLEKGGKKRIGL